MKTFRLTRRTRTSRVESREKFSFFSFPFPNEFAFYIFPFDSHCSYSQIRGTRMAVEKSNRTLECTNSLNIKLVVCFRELLMRRAEIFWNPRLCRETINFESFHWNAKFIRLHSWLWSSKWFKRKTQNNNQLACWLCYNGNTRYVRASEG